MATITFIEPGGAEKTIQAEDGMSLMLAANLGGVDGIAAECGGNCVCATCHCLVLEGPADAVPSIGEEEDETLEYSAEERFEGSRLSCQIEAGPALDGLVLKVIGR